MKLKKMKVISRKPATKPYFGVDVHDAIIEYQNTACEQEKHEIYEAYIKSAFEKLSENLIFIYGFSRDQDHFYVLKSDCVSFLYETLYKFNSEKGSKAFSYFNACAKNHLLANAKKTQKTKVRNISIDDFQSLTPAEKDAIETFNFIPSQDDVFIKEEDKIILKDVLTKIKTKPLNENEKICIDAVITLFKNIEEVEFLNKRAVFVYLREISGLNAKQLSSSLSRIRKYYKDIARSDDHFLLFG